MVINRTYVVTATAFKGFIIRKSLIGLLKTTYTTFLIESKHLLLHIFMFFAALLKEGKEFDSHFSSKQIKLQRPPLEILWKLCEARRWSH